MNRIELPGVSDEQREELARLKADYRNVTVRWAVAMMATRKHFYAGTVPAYVIETRRARNRVAKRSRKTNRRK